MKRLFDLLASLCVLLLLSPLLLISALLVWRFHGRPVLFAQRRPGWRGRPFLIYKFRTMTQARDAQGNLLPDAWRLARRAIPDRLSGNSRLPIQPLPVCLLRRSLSALWPT